MKIEIVKKRREERKPPGNLIEADNNVFSHEFIKSLPPVHLVSLKGAIILKDVVFRFPKFYDKFCLITGHSFFQRLKRIGLIFMSGYRIKKGIWIIDKWSYAYFHWFADALPRLWVCRSYLNNHIVLLPDTFKKYSYIEETLNNLGVQYCFFNSYKKVKIKELLMPEHVAETGHYNSEVMLQLRDFFIKPYSTVTRFRKLYISRRKATIRKVVNEDELESLFGEFGFQVVVLEEFTLSKQIEIVSESVIIAGVHGAGLTNMLFLNPGSKVIELRRTGDNHNNCYFSLAAALNLDYYYLNCNTTGSYTQTTDFVVDLQEMKNLLKIVSA